MLKKLFTQEKNFGEGSLAGIIMGQAIPLTIAQLVQLAYNLVDRIYIGHLGTGSSLALTGIGLTFPLMTLIIAFTALFGFGGTPGFAMARGAGNFKRAERIMGNSFMLLVISSVVLAAFFMLFCRPILYLFGAGDDSYVYAAQYLRIYLIGTPFVMLSAGLNGYINAQGHPLTGMVTVIIGAVINILLDPILIFGFGMGIRGAAIASVISQFMAALWAVAFLTGKRANLKLKPVNFRPDIRIIGNILKNGLSFFVMQGTNCVVQAVCNATLQLYGGDLYVCIMTVVNSVREVMMLPVTGLFNGSQPVIGFNYGAGKYDRVTAAIRFTTVAGFFYTLIIWLFVILFPALWFYIFSDNAETVLAGIPMLKLYFFGFIFMAFQYAGQTVFQALGDARHGVFFSLFRKIIMVVPLTLLLPGIHGLGVTGVFLAEPISNVIGGLACFITMLFTVYRKLKRKAELNTAQE